MVKTMLANLSIELLRCSPKAMAEYAYHNTVFYHNLYRDYNINDFENLPVFTKHHLREISPYDLLSHPYRNKVFLYGETSGSSGCSTPSFFTKKDFSSLISLSMLSPFTPLLNSVIKNNKTAVNGLTFGFTIAGFSFGALLQNYGAMVAQLGSRSTIAVPERTASSIVRLKPGIISSTPLDFMTWMEIIRTDHSYDYEEVRNSIKVLMSAAEPCSKSRQEQIERYFGITHINTYASVDGFVSIPCTCGEMHILDGLHHIELYDHKLNSIGDKGKGRLCFTNLVRKTTPMVKYLLDDLVTVQDSKCPNGYKKSIIPHGRYELSLDLNNKLLGNGDFEEIIYKHGLFMDYRINVEEDKIFIQLEKYPIASKDYNLEGICRDIKEETGMECSVTLCDIGEMTSYRKVRSAKSIIKVLDHRKASRQEMPRIL